jgi:hypothetical protein
MCYIKMLRKGRCHLVELNAGSFRGFPLSQHILQHFVTFYHSANTHNAPAASFSLQPPPLAPAAQPYAARATSGRHPPAALPPSGSTCRSAACSPRSLAGTPAAARHVRAERTGAWVGRARDLLDCIVVVSRLLLQLTHNVGVYSPAKCILRVWCFDLDSWTDLKESLLSSICRCLACSALVAASLCDLKLSFAAAMRVSFEC